MNRIAHVECPSDGLLPAVVVGYTIKADTLLPAVENPDGLWTHVDQQAGGYACTQHALVGLVLRFRGNADRALQNPERFLRGFTLLAEDPDCLALQRDYPDLECLLTWGRPYSAPQFDAFNAFVQSYFPLPSTRSGEEAIIELEGDPLAWFTGWRIWACAHSAVDCVDHTNVDLLTAHERHVFNSDRLLQLEETLCPRLGGALVGGPTVRSHFIWHNSD